MTVIREGNVVKTDHVLRNLRPIPEHKPTRVTFAKKKSVEQVASEIFGEFWSQNPEEFHEQYVAHMERKKNESK